MAKRRKSSGRRRRRTTSMSAPRRHRRRRTLSAGASLFKAVSNPIIGGALGALVARAGSNIAKKAFGGDANTDMIIDAAPALIGVMLMKKAPSVAAGMIGSAIVKTLESQIPLLNENSSTNFADPRLLSGSQRVRMLNEAGWRNTATAPY